MKMPKVAMPQNRAQSKLVKEIVILVLIVGVLGWMLFPHHKKSQKSGNLPAAGPARINTSFDQNALQQLQSKDTDYPDVSPKSGDLGKSDPFQ